jgi:hypothetical protein
VPLSTAIACAWRSIGFVNKLLEDEFVDLLIKYWKNCGDFEHWVHWPELLKVFSLPPHLPSDVR